MEKNTKIVNKHFHIDSCVVIQDYGSFDICMKSAPMKTKIKFQRYLILKYRNLSLKTKISIFQNLNEVYMYKKMITDYYWDFLLDFSCALP